MSFPESPGASGRDDLLEPVRRRGPRMSAFRRSALGVSLAAVAALGSVLAYARTGTDQRTSVAASGSTPAFSTATTTTTTTAPPPTSSSAAPDTTPAPAPAPVPETVTTTTAPAEIPKCTGSDFEVTVTTDQPSYPQGTVVTVTVSGRNVSGHSCWQEMNTCGSAYSIEAATGETVWGPSFWACLAYSQRKVVAAGETISESGGWDQRTCSPPPPWNCGYTNPDHPAAPPGQYRALSWWPGGKQVGSDLFQIG